ncbi:hypothetical protein LNKW23_04440 [Paralimibaculum aggregatum]|uniref:DUF3168 domain-containing protein n=1 Tax=Paralimibaculum aggregatum TaxID=3036245 RepID=A0ABQ6LHW7_9RHOB|nr:DUF3168 domain-containing protein [Limibaculum sp. NKW23]GMG81232.1 hypothetical protein LNKW23_04440 [Limibaculum sp. NKW23]
MTYALAWALQQALYARLAADPALAALAGGRIWDAAPPETGAADALYVVLGDEEARDFSTATDRGAEHVLTISVVTPQAGFAEAKQAAAAICDALLGAELALARGRLICLGFQGALAERLEKDALRRIRLRFRALLEDT